jgi:DNA-binding CsgD family transcriptional regulator
MTGTRQAELDLRSVHDVVVAAREAGPAPPGLPDVVLRRLEQLVPCDLVSFVDLDVAARVTHVDQECAGGQVSTTTRDEPDDDDPFFRHYADTASCSYATRTGDDLSITARSDFYSDRAWRRTGMYVDCFQGTGLENELICCLPLQRTRTRRLVFFRSAGTDFDERDRLVLALRRPHLAELHALGERTRYAESPLTPRQRELLRLVAAGHTNAEVASRLFLTSNTVRKHLENIFERLQVTSRTAAVSRAFPDGVAGV